MLRRLAHVLTIAGVLLAASLVSAQPEAVAQEAAKQSVTSIVRETMLGALAVLGVVLAVWAIRAMREELLNRVEDKDKLAQRLETSNEKDRLALAEHTKIVSDLASNVRDCVRITGETRQGVSDLVKAVEGVVRDAINIRRSGQSGSTQAVSRRKEDV